MGSRLRTRPRCCRKNTGKLLKPTHDPKKTPFLKTKEDIGQLFSALYADRPVLGVAYALTALCGLRPGEARALRWSDVDLEKQLLYVRESVEGPTKDKDGRPVPMPAGLHELLTKWRDAAPVATLVCPPLRKTGPYWDDKTVWKSIRKACKANRGLLVEDGRTRAVRPPTWYEAGRHSFASQWVATGGSMEKLSTILGHSTVLVTQRYAHLKPELFPKEDRERANIPLVI